MFRQVLLPFMLPFYLHLYYHSIDTLIIIIVIDVLWYPCALLTDLFVFVKDLKHDIIGLVPVYIFKYLINCIGWVWGYIVM